MPQSICRSHTQTSNATIEMGRYTDADSDAERLPEGMKRIGYDADTQVYTFKDADGKLWEGPPGAEYGRLHRGMAPLFRPSIILIILPCLEFYYSSHSPQHFN